MHTLLRIAAFVATAALVTACFDDGDHDHSGGALAAPTELAATPVAGAVHLTWKDNSDGELEFMVLRKSGAADWALVDSTAADATSYHDDSVAAETTYMYMVHAMAGSVSSEPSNVVSVMVP